MPLVPVQEIRRAPYCEDEGYQAHSFWHHCGRKVLSNKHVEKFLFPLLYRRTSTQTFFLCLLSFCTHNDRAELHGLLSMTSLWFMTACRFASPTHRPLPLPLPLWLPCIFLTSRSIRRSSLVIDEDPHRCKRKSLDKPLIELFSSGIGTIVGSGDWGGGGCDDVWYYS